jgi:hypothetical protein
VLRWEGLLRRLPLGYSLVERAGLFVPFERWQTEHGDTRVSPWGVGFHTELDAMVAVDANIRGADFGGSVKLADADYHALSAEIVKEIE